MQVIRFDPEVGIPVRAHASSFRLSPLASGTATVQVVHLEADEQIGRHPSVGRQLLAVLAGRATATGGDGRTRWLEAGWGVIWEQGEEHEVDTDDGFTGVILEGDFDSTAFAVTKDLIVVDYDPEWPQSFARIHAFVWPALEGIADRIDHVGSTSVQGLAAKPVIDMDVVVTSENGIRPAINALTQIGYQWRGDYGVRGREAFRVPAARVLPAHNLYVVVDGNKAHLDHTLLRDEMREDTELRERYGELKRANAIASGGDIDWYVAAKATFVAEVLTAARAKRGLPPETYWDPDKPDT